MTLSPSLPLRKYYGDLSDSPNFSGLISDFMQINCDPGTAFNPRVDMAAPAASRVEFAELRLVKRTLRNIERRRRRWLCTHCVAFCLNLLGNSGKSLQLPFPCPFPNYSDVHFRHLLSFFCSLPAIRPSWILFILSLIVGDIRAAEELKNFPLTKWPAGFVWNLRTL